jgi:hypothetical protein
VPSALATFGNLLGVGMDPAEHPSRDNWTFNLSGDGPVCVSLALTVTLTSRVIETCKSLAGVERDFRSTTGARPGSAHVFTLHAPS